MMKKRIALLLALSLLLCTACTVETANPTVAPTVQPTTAHVETPTQAPTNSLTEPPTEEPTAAPTESPLPAGPVDVELITAGVLTPMYRIVTNRKEVMDNLRHADFVSEPMHSKEQILQHLDDELWDVYDQCWMKYSRTLDDGTYVEMSRTIDWSSYDDAFFEENSIVVILAVTFERYEIMSFSTDGIVRTETGAYKGTVLATPPPLSDMEYGCVVTVGFLIMKGVTDDASTEIELVGSLIFQSDPQKNNKIP